MSDPALLGAGLGLGLLVLVAGSRRRPPIGAAGPPGAHAPGLPAPGRSWWRASLVRCGETLDRIPESRASAGARSRDLEAAGRTIDNHLLMTAVGTLGGMSALVLVCTFGLLAGVHVPSATTLGLCGAGGATGLVGVRLELHHAARRSREQFRRALWCWLDLVALAQAGGMGVESALEAATGISSDPAFARLRQALDRGRRSGTTPWDELGRLGDRMGVDELDELAVSLRLAGSEGARVRASLQAKSASLRRRLMTEAESRANSTTERLFLPSVVLMLGFLVFVMYPAGVSLSHVL